MEDRGRGSKHPGKGSLEPAAPGATTAPLSSTRPETERAPLALHFVHPPKFAQLRHPLGSETLIGRDPGADLVLDDETISRRHARVRRAGLAHALADLGSRNGTFSDGVRSELAQLELGRVVRFGDCVAVVCEHVPGDVGVREVAPQLLGSHALARLVELAERVARSSATVLINGETGTGKELFARIIHEASARSGPLVAMNCAALPEHLLEAELFGHERGAFTGAERARSGLIRQSHGGTLFLDEIADLPLPAQAKLLRVLEEHTVLPIGRSQPVSVDLRVVCASHGDLGAMVAAGTFRADLHARLEGVVLRLPALRERRQDAVELFLSFAEQYRNGSRPTLSATFVEGLCCQAWPRNVRQLRQLAERLSALSSHKPEWRRRDLRASLPEPSAPAPSAPSAGPTPTAASTRPRPAALLAALSAAGGNVTVAARALSISKQTLYKYIALAGIDLTQLRERSLEPEPGSRQ